MKLDIGLFLVVWVPVRMPLPTPRTLVSKGALLLLGNRVHAATGLRLKDWVVAPPGWGGPRTPVSAVRRPLRITVEPGQHATLKKLEKTQEKGRLPYGAAITQEPRSFHQGQHAHDRPTM